MSTLNKVCTKPPGEGSLSCKPACTKPPGEGTEKNNNKKHCDVCNVDITKSNWHIHQATIKHQNNEKTTNGIDVEKEKLLKIIHLLQQELLKIRFELNTAKLQNLPNL